MNNSNIGCINLELMFLLQYICEANGWSKDSCTIEATVTNLSTGEKEHYNWQRPNKES